MSMPQKDNSASASKRALRDDAVREVCGNTPPRVLDAFAGYGLMWRDVRTAKYLGFEKDKKKRTPGVMNVDNLKMLASLDLSEFDVIDLDSYGVPEKQLAAIFDNGTYRIGSAIVYTFIETAQKRMPSILARNIGCEDINNAAPMLAANLCEESFYDYLRRFAEKRREITIIANASRKHYGYVIVDKK